MRILLVKPKARLRTVRGLEAFTILEPLEFGYLAAAVSPEHDVRVLDLRLERFPNRAFLRALRRVRPDLVGISGYSHEASMVKALARTVKTLAPKTPVIVGGHHATCDPEDLNIESIDAIVRGEGCEAFRAIVKARGQREELADIPAVLVPGPDFDHDKAKGWPQYGDPSLLPTPRRDLVDYRSYRSVWTAEHMENWAPLFPPVSMVRASWGCRARCTFCVVPFMADGKHFPNQAERVAEEIAQAPAQYIYFCDDENFIDADYAFELADALEAEPALAGRLVGGEREIACPGQAIEAGALDGPGTLEGPAVLVAGNVHAGPRKVARPSHVIHVEVGQDHVPHVLRIEAESPHLLDGGLRPLEARPEHELQRGAQPLPAALDVARAEAGIDQHQLASGLDEQAVADHLGHRQGTECRAVEVVHPHGLPP